MRSPPKVTVLPAGGGRWAEAAAQAVVAGGGMLVDNPEDADALVWTAGGIDPAATALALKDTLRRCPALRWIQLPWAGVEQYAAAGLFDRDHIWTCAKGIYAPPVAEHALALTLACLRSFKSYSRAETWTGEAGRTLFGTRVTVFGGGGIAQEFVQLLAPFGCDATVVRKRPEPLDRGSPVRVVGWEGRDAAVERADVVVLALALTPETAGMMGRNQFALMPNHACMVNVARGQHVVTDDLVDALESGEIASAGLDVTDPEPLPDGHRLWLLDNCLITPHTANRSSMAIPVLARRIIANVQRFAAGEPLEGVVDPALGY